MKNHTRKCIVDQKVYPINNLIRFTYINQKLIIDKHFDKKIGGSVRLHFQ